MPPVPSDSGAVPRFPSNSEEMLREVYFTMCVSRPGKPCIVDQLSRGEERMEAQGLQIEEARRVADKAHEDARDALREVREHRHPDSSPSIGTRAFEAMVMGAAGVVGAALPGALIIGLLWQAGTFMGWGRP
jgi:hypothetical protein